MCVMFNGHQNRIDDFLLACIVAILFSFPSGEWLLRFLRPPVSSARALWNWLAKWKLVETVFTVGWGLMLGAHEYCLSLIFLGMATIGAFSSVSHWRPSWRGGKVLASVAIIGGCGLMTLVTLANKGNQQCSQIPDYLASQITLPPAPESVSKVQTAPKMTHTSKEAWLEAQKALEEFIKAKQPKLAAVTSEKSRFEASFWPATLDSWPIRETTLPVVNGVVTVHLTAMVKDHMAKKTQLWLRLCKGCKYAKEPSGFKNYDTQIPGESDEAHERLLVPPAGQTFFLVGINVGCENCDPVNARTFQSLRVNIQR